MHESGRRKPRPSAVSEADQLRELTRDAHAAVKDLRAAIREARKVAAGVVADTQAAGSEELARYSRHLQQEMNRSTADLNASVQVARDHLVKALTMAKLERDPETNMLLVHFAGDLFNAEVPLPEGPEMGQ